MTLTVLLYLFAITSGVIGYQAMTFLARFVRTGARQSLCCLFFALSSAAYALFLFLLYTSQGDTAQIAVMLGILSSMLAMGFYLKAMSTYFGSRSRLINAGVILILCLAAAYACLATLDLTLGTHLLITEKPNPANYKSAMLPTNFANHYDLTPLSTCLHAANRLVGTILLIYLLATGNVKRDRMIQVGMIISIAFILHNMITANWAWDYYVPLIAFMNLVELGRLEWRARSGDRLRLANYEQQVASFDQGLNEHLKLKSIGEQATTIIHDATNIAIANDYNIREIENLARKTGNDQIVDLVRDARKHNQRLFDLISTSRESHLTNRGGQYLDLAPIINDAMSFCSHRIMSNGITLRRSGESTRPVLGDRIKLSQAVINLVNNACDAVAHLPERLITIRISEAPGQTTISVINNGPKISADLAEKIFKPFFSTKGSGTGTGVGVGVGVGLNICQKNLAAMNGKLVLNTNEPHTCFDIVLQSRPDRHPPTDSA